MNLPSSAISRKIAVTFVGDRLRHPGALPHALAVTAHATLGGIAQTDTIECLPGPDVGLRVGEAVDAQIRVDELIAGEPRREGVVLAAVAHPPEELLRLIGGQPENRHPPLARLQQTGHEVHEGRLARAVGADEARDAGPDGEVDPIDAEHLAVELRDVLEANRPTRL
jgi:hypothetical protein